MTSLPKAEASLPKAEVHQKIVFVKGEITYLPHYVYKHMYVSPGYGLTHEELFTEKELRNMGAKQQVMMLWSRSW